MTPKQLLRRVEFWQKALEPLGLLHWRIDVQVTDDVPGGETNIAACEVSEQYNDVTLYFAYRLIDGDSPQKIDETIIHELIHIVFRDFDMTINEVETWMPEATWRDFHGRVYREREGVVDQMARAIYACHSE